MMSRLAVLLLVLLAVRPAAAEVLLESKISDTRGGFSGGLTDDDRFGTAVARLDDVNGDHVKDLAVGGNRDDDGGSDRGAVWILFLNRAFGVLGFQKISDTEGGFDGALADGDRFGTSIAVVGDLDGNGVDDLAAGAEGDDDGGDRRGAVWILFLEAGGTVIGEQKISDVAGGFGGALDNTDAFGTSAAGLGDLDGDGVPDLAVGAFQDDDCPAAFTNCGAVWILFLNADGTVKAEQKISEDEGGFPGGLDASDNFGFSVARIGDLDRDGVVDIAVGAPFDDDGAGNTGAVWIVFLNTDGTVKGVQKISATEGGFTGDLDGGDHFGAGVSGAGDFNHDGVPDLAIGAEFDDDGVTGGAVWVLFLKPDGTVLGHKKISETEGGLVGPLDFQDHFGRAIANLGDGFKDGVDGLVVGANFDDDGGSDRGAAYILVTSIFGAPAPTMDAAGLVVVLLVLFAIANGVVLRGRRSAE